MKWIFQYENFARTYVAEWTRHVWLAKVWHTAYVIFFCRMGATMLTIVIYDKYVLKYLTRNYHLPWKVTTLLVSVIYSCLTLHVSPVRNLPKKKTSFIRYA